MAEGDEEWRVRAADITGRWQAIREFIPWAGRVVLALAVTVPIRFSIAVAELIAGRETEVVIDLSLAGSVSAGVSVLVGALLTTVFQLRRQNGILRRQLEELQDTLDKLEGPQEEDPDDDD